MKQSILFLISFLFGCLYSPNALLAQNPLQARVDQAYQEAWAQHYDKAIILFSEILEAHPTSMDAQLGRGWTLAWAGQHEAARADFETVLTNYPDQWEARKGLAYVALWEGEYERAIRLFRKLLLEKPEEEELIMAMGLARVNAGFLKGARISYRELEAKESPEAPDLLAAIYHAPAWLEIDTWLGISNLASSQRWGLRAFRVALNPSPAWGVWARYDNSLSLDGGSTLQISSLIPTLFAGGIIHPNKRLSTRIELGMRDLPDSELSWLLMGEQAIWLKDGIALKLGGLYDVGSTSRIAEHLLYTGVAVRMGKNFWIEPMYFHMIRARQSGGEQRLSLSGKYHWKTGMELQVGGIYGQYKVDATALGAPISGGWIRYQHPIAKRHWLFLILRRETTQIGVLRIAAIGLKVRIEK